MKRFGKTLITLLLVFAMIFAFTACGETVEEHKCGHICEVCGKCTDPDCTDPVCKDKCEGHTVVAYDEETAEEFYFEAEYAEISGAALKHSYMAYQGNGHIVDGTPSMQLEGGLMALPHNNGLFVGYLGTEGSSITWVIKSNVACKALLSISMSGNYKGPGDPSLMAVSLNGEDVPFEPQGNCLSRAFSEGIGVVVELVKGENTIVLTSKDAFSTEHDYWEGVNSQRFLDTDYLKLSACVDASNFTFVNEKALNSDDAHTMNPNGKITKYEPSWHKSAQ